MRARLVSSAVVAVTSFLVVAGCTGRVAGQDLLVADPDPTNPTNPPTPTDPDLPCATIAPACDPADVQYSSDGACKSAGNDYCYTRSSTCNGRIVSTIICGRGTSQCDGIPVCDEGDRETAGCPKDANARCYTRTVCGTTIQCVHYEPTCGAVPSCDGGDALVPAGSALCSSPSYSCYTRTVCGTTITCAKKK
ncbi:MAG: hypothetical protein JST00_05565 [Deltaproteobacteria bacterium]|nr:hypothetical protein [Deltaproteobacteria bacterium]